MNRALDIEAYSSRSLDTFTSYQFDQSIIFCKRALTIKPDDYDAHFLWGSRLNGKDSYEKSIRKHKEVIYRNPKDYNAYNNYGLALERQNKLSEAEIQFKKSIEIDSSDQFSRHNMAIVLTKQRKFTKALEQFEKILLARDEESLASTLTCHGYLKFILGQYEEAIESFEKAIRQDVNLSLTYFNKALALYCLRKQEFAVETFQGTLKRFACLQGWSIRLQKTILAYTGELSWLKELSEKDDLGEISREQLIINIKGLEYFLDLLKQELAELLVDLK